MKSGKRENGMSFSFNLFRKRSINWAGLVLLSHRMYLLISFRKSNPPQNRQLDILISDSKQQVVDFCGGVDFLKFINECILRDTLGCILLYDEQEFAMLWYRCRANTARIRQSRPDCGLDFQEQMSTPCKLSLSARKQPMNFSNGTPVAEIGTPVAEIHWPKW